MTALSDADQDAGLREEIARAGFAGWYGRDEYDDHPVQGMWERAADAIMRGPLATLRARATAAEEKLKDREAEIERLRAEMPESLNTGNLVHDVQTLRMAHDSMHRHAYRWGRAALLLLPFVDMAAGEGLEWAEQDDGSPRMDAADLCAAFAKAMGCELGDTAYTAMMAEGQAAIRAALASTEPHASSEEATDAR